MNGAQITMLFFVALGLLISAAQDGEKKTVTNKFSVDFVSILITQSILYWGGFWS